MDVATRISLLFILCGKLHAKECNPTLTDQGNNETIYIDMIITDGDTHLEIYFNGYISNQHFTNVFLYMKGNEKNICINSNYTGRIERIVNSNGQLSFMLLNVMFSDSGIYTIKRTPEVKETTCVLVSRRIVDATLWEPLIFSFIVDEKNTSFIRVEHPISKLNQSVVIYNATYNTCTYIDFVSMEKKNIENCVLNNGKFSYTIPEVGWLHKGSYFAWDDKGRLLDSIFLDIKGNNIIGFVDTPMPLDIEKRTLGNPLQYVVLAIGGIFIAFLAYLHHRFRIRLHVDILSNIDTSKVCEKDHVVEVVQDENSLGGYLTVVRSEISESSTFDELDVVQDNEVPFLEQNVVIAKHELQQSMRLESDKGNDALDGYLHPVM